jgi:hypothetical protein
LAGIKFRGYVGKFEALLPQATAGRGRRYKAVNDQWQLEYTVIIWLMKGCSPCIWAKNLTEEGVP